MSTDIIICDICNSSVQRRNLTDHKKTKKCLLTKNKELSHIIENEDLKSRNKELELSLKKEYKLSKLKETKINELEISNAVLQKEIEMLKNENLMLKKLYDDVNSKHNEHTLKNNEQSNLLINKLVDKPTSITHTTNNNQNTIFNNLSPLNLSLDYVQSILPEYTEEHFLNGIQGTIEWSAPIITDANGKSNYIVTDKNRGYAFYKNMDGTKVEDIHCKNLVESFKPILEPQLVKIKKKLDDEIMEKYGNDDNAYQFYGGKTNLITRKQNELKQHKKDAVNNKLYFRNYKSQTK